MAKVIVGMGTVIYHDHLSNIHPRARIGHHCVIHSHVEIHETVVIGNWCKIQSFCYLPNGVTLGDRVFVGPGVIFTNDKYPPSGGLHWASTIVEEGAVIGAGAVILPGITIGKGAVIGAGTVVTKDVPGGLTVVGNPARVMNPKGY